MGNIALRDIPPEDYKTLEKFFDYLLHYSTIGYALCGEKPVAIDTFPSLAHLPPAFSVSILAQCQGYSILGRGWEVWQRYSASFPSDRFVFRYVEDFNTIVLVNKEFTKKVIHENLDLFQKYSGLEQTVGSVLDQVCTPIAQEYMISFNQALLGILLGFGRNNSVAFSNRSLIQKLEVCELWHYDNSLIEYATPGFILINNGTNENENERVKKVFKEAKIKIQKSFQNGQYFKTFIELFTL